MNKWEQRTKRLGSLPLFFLRLLLRERKHCLHKDGALKALFLNSAAHLIGVADVPVKEVGIRMTAAAAIKTRPAVPAERLIQHMRVAKICREFCILYARKDRP